MLIVFFDLYMCVWTIYDSFVSIWALFFHHSFYHHYHRHQMKHQLDGTKSMEKLYECLLMMKIDFFSVFPFHIANKQVAIIQTSIHEIDDGMFDSRRPFFSFILQFLSYIQCFKWNELNTKIHLTMTNFFCYVWLLLSLLFFHSKLWNNIGKWIFWITKWNKLRLKMIGKHNHHL